MKHAQRLTSILLLLFLTLVHSVAMAGHRAPGAAGDLEHALLHWADIAHHHQDDNIQIEGTSDAVAHIHADGCMNAACLVSSGFALLLPCARSHKQTFLADLSRPSPVLEGPRRPPRLTV